jgi:hypothetical protein
MGIDHPHDLKILLEATRTLHEAPIDAGEADRSEFHIRVAGQRGAGGENGAVRLEKVAKVRAALSAGNYSVPAEAVAFKMLDAMLAREQERLREDRRKRPRVGHRSLMRGRARRETC